MRIYGCLRTRSVRALWALEEAGAQYDYVHVDLRKGEGRKSPFLQVNPGGKVPALVDGDVVLTESGAICVYIAEKFPAAKLIPVFARERAQCMQWCFFALSELEQPLWTMSKHTFVLPEQRRVSAIMDTARWEFGKAADVLAQSLGDREFLVGENCSIADILVAHTLGWAQASNIELSRALQSYAQRLLSRPALARAQQREQLAAQS